MDHITRAYFSFLDKVILNCIIPLLHFIVKKMPIFGCIDYSITKLLLLSFSKRTIERLYNTTTPISVETLISGKLLMMSTVGTKRGNATHNTFRLSLLVIYPVGSLSGRICSLALFSVWLDALKRFLNLLRRKKRAI